jgi:hypothetical protein
MKTVRDVLDRIRAEFSGSDEDMTRLRSAREQNAAGGPLRSSRNRNDH